MASASQVRRAAGWIPGVLPRAFFPGKEHVPGRRRTWVSTASCPVCSWGMGLTHLVLLKVLSKPSPSCSEKRTEGRRNIPVFSSCFAEACLCNCLILHTCAAGRPAAAWRARAGGFPPLLPPSGPCTAPMACGTHSHPPVL